jgi:nucleotide-binding universal stress UspA family protein
MPGPVLFCYDGSEGSRTAMAAAVELIARPTPAVVLTVWQPAAVLLARAGGFGTGYLSDEERVDAGQAQLAGDAAVEGVERARAHGYDASSRVEETTEGAGRKIIEIADELDARLIVCGRRGLGAVASALLGSVSHVVLAHAGRPVLIVPEG